MEIEKALASAIEEHALMLVADADGRIVHASAHTASIWGMRPDELRGIDLAVALSGEEKTTLANFWPTLRQGRPWVGDIARVVDSQVVWLRIVVLPIRAADETSRYVALVFETPGPLRAESELRDAIELYRTAPYGIQSMDAEGVIVKVNATWLAWTGYTRQEVEGKMRFEDVLMPESLPLFRRSYFDFQERGFAGDHELVLRRKDGKGVPVLMSTSSVRDDTGKFVRSRAVLVDLSERKRVEQAAMQITDRLIDAVESVQHPFSIFDADDRLVLANRAYREMFPFEMRDSLVGMSFEQILDLALQLPENAMLDETPEQYRRRRLAYRAAPLGAFEERRLDGRAFRLLERRTKEGGLVSFRWDITEDVRREAELREARALADAANAAKSEFLSSMSHELRTPLNAILGFSQLLQRDNDPALTPRQLGYLKHVIRGGEHLLRLIDDILDLARIESGALPMSPESVAVADVLRETVATLGPMAESRGIELRLPPVSLEIPHVLADRTRLSQILLNFGSNAIKYNRPNGQVVLTAAIVEDRVRISVTDTGIGIAPEKVAGLFQAFSRLGQESGPIEGTGIGLAITKRLAELMGGKVGVRSVPNEGSEFWIELPPYMGLDDEVTRKTSPVPGPRDFQIEKSRETILYVEDNPANLALMQELIASLDRHELLTAPNAEIGIELARAHRPALIVLDINLPGMNGYEALAHLRRWPETRNIPVLALSASAMERDVRRALQAGFAQYLTKPIKLDELIQALETWLPETMS